MIFGRHNFTSNFLNAVGYQDEFMADQIIIDEVARLIVEDKKNVVEALRKAGVNSTYRDNNDLVKAMLIKEVEDGNKDIIKWIADKIVQNQVDELKLKEIVALPKSKSEGKNSTIKNATGSFADNLGKVLQNENVKEAVSGLIASGVSKLFSKKNTQKASNDQQLAERLKINEMQAATAKTKKKKTLVILLVIAGTLTIAGVVFFLVKRKYEKGGMVPGSDSNSNLSTTSMPPSNNAQSGE